MSVVVNVVGETAVSVSVAASTGASVSVAASTGASVVASGGIGPAGFITVPGTSTSAFGTFQIVPGDGITVSTANGQFLISSYPSTTLSSLAPVQSVAGRTGSVVLQASDVTAGTFAIGRIPTIGYTALSGVPTAFAPASHTHDASAVASGTLSIARIPTISFTALANVPATFAPSAHTHSTADITGFTGSFEAGNHTHDAAAVTSGVFGIARIPVIGYTALSGVPSTFAPSTHTHSTADIAAISASFAAVSHTHDAAALTSGTLDIARIPTIGYTALSGVPATFLPQAHTHSTTDVVGLTASFSQVGHAHQYVQVLNGLTGTISIAAGAGVTVSTASGSITILAGGGGGGVGENDTVDGGNYVGEIINGITFAVQPSSQTLNLGGVGNWSTGNAVPSGSAMFSLGDNAVLAKLAFQQYGGSSGNIALRMASNAASVASATPYVVNLTVPSISNSLNMSVATSGSQTMFLTYYSSSGSDISLLLSTTDNGSTWSAINAPSGALRIAGASAGFVATTYSASTGFQGYWSSNLVQQTSDGVNWNARTLPATDVWKIAGGGSLFVAVAPSSNVSAYSTNGVSWTSATPPVSSGLLDITYGGGLYVAISTDRSYVTTNGVSWSAGNLPTSNYDRVVYAGGRFIATTSVSSTDIATSVDGVTWTLGTLPASRLWRWVAYAGGNYAAMQGQPLSDGSNLAIAAVATNGSASFTVSAATSGGGAISYQWQSSTDAGTTWSNVTNATSSTLNLTGLTVANSGTRYRAIASATGATSATSQSATLTVI